MKIAQDYHYRGKDWWDWSVWLDATPRELSAVKEVIWHLHPSFSPSKRVRNDRSDAFRLETAGWGTFTIRAEVKLSNGSVRKLKHELELYYDEEE